jgi:hypothetical protein
MLLQMLLAMLSGTKNHYVADACDLVVSECSECYSLLEQIPSASYICRRETIDPILVHVLLLLTLFLVI